MESEDSPVWNSSKSYVFLNRQLTEKTLQVAFNKFISNFDFVKKFKKILSYKMLNTRISLAYFQLNEIPQEILTSMAAFVEFLDLSYNSFTDLNFLKHFPKLHTLVLDRNSNLDHTTLPAMDNLKVLWLNNCNLIDIEMWLFKLIEQCPKLAHLSMMCNPVGHTLLNGVTHADELAYRKHVASLLPNLKSFDGISLHAMESSLSSVKFAALKSKLQLWLQRSRLNQSLNVSYIESKLPVSLWA